MTPRSTRSALPNYLMAVILHIDLDVIDASQLPGQRRPAPDSPTPDSVLTAISRLLASSAAGAECTLRASVSVGLVGCETER